MAKKTKINYKTLKVNQEALSSTVIGELPNDQKGPIFVILFFVLLLVIVFFLPDIVNYINNRDNGVVVAPNNPGQEASGNIDDRTEIVFYDISDNLSITLDDILVINKFKVNNDSISFRITNNGESRYYFNRYNYFMELYNENNTLLERVILQKEGISRDSYKDYNYELKTETALQAKKIVFVNIPTDGYPNVVLNNNVLVCTKNYQTITYNFANNKLINISDMINYLNTIGSEYQTNLIKYQNQVSVNNNIAGVRSTLTESSNGFTVSTILDLVNVDITKLVSDNYYAFDTAATIVNFEMESRGYSCN